MISDNVNAWIQPTNIPGLFDVRTSDGKEYRDLTINQLTTLAKQHNWRVMQVPR